MSNEEYWMAHEFGEKCRREYILLLLPTRNPPNDSLCFRWPNLISMDVLDEKQKRGRLIVGGKVSE